MHFCRKDKYARLIIAISGKSAYRYMYMYRLSEGEFLLFPLFAMIKTSQLFLIIHGTEQNTIKSILFL